MSLVAQLGTVSTKSNALGTVHGTLPPQLLTLDQVADLMNVSKAWVRDHCTRRRPLIPVVRFGGRRAVLRFRPQDIEMFITNNLLSAGVDAQ